MLREICLGSAFVLPTLASAATANDVCGVVPYTVQAKDLYGKVVMKMPVFFSDPTNMPKPLNVAAGASYIRTMYGAMGPTVIREVLSNYVCRFDRVVDADDALSVEIRDSYKATFQNAVDDISDSSALYFSAFANTPALAETVRPTLVKFPALAKAYRLPEKYLAQSIGLIPDNSFLIQNNYDAYIQGSYGGVEVTACGKFIRAALAENAGTVQHIAAAMRATLLAYFRNSDAGVKSAMSMIFAEASSASLVGAPTKLENQSLAGGCAI